MLSVAQLVALRALEKVASQHRALGQPAHIACWKLDMRIRLHLHKGTAESMLRVLQAEGLVVLLDKSGCCYFRNYELTPAARVHLAPSGSQQSLI